MEANGFDIIKDWNKTIGTDAVIRIIYREHNGEYTKEEIAKRIEEDGANAIDSRFKYVGFGRYIYDQKTNKGE